MQWVRKRISHMTCMETAYISHIKTNKLWTSWSSTLFCSQLTCAARCRVPDGWLIDHWYLRLWMLFWGAHGSAAARAVEGRRRERWGGGGGGGRRRKCWIMDVEGVERGIPLPPLLPRSQSVNHLLHGSNGTVHWRAGSLQWTEGICRGWDRM